tara:strand:- start:369 stop:539 length:171 start_codon:yes stop_codon:yes gene_type:complete
MYSEIKTYTSMSGFIQAHEGLWHMLGVKYKKLDKENIMIDNITWKLMKGNMRCLTK